MYSGNGVFDINVKGMGCLFGNPPFLAEETLYDNPRILSGLRYGEAILDVRLVME